MRDERVGETTERDRDEDELSGGGRTHYRHPRCVTTRSTREPQHGLRERETQREREGKLPQFRNHRGAPSPLAARTPLSCAFFSASAASGGM